MTPETTLAEAYELDVRSFAQSPQFPKLADTLRQHFKITRPVWSKVEDRLATEFMKMLDIKILTILYEGWKKANSLREFTDPVKYPADRRIEPVPLLEHQITSTYHPSLIVRVAEVELGTPVQFDLTTVLKLRGILLAIQGGRIYEIRAGSIEGTLRLEWKRVDLLKVETNQIPIPSAMKVDIQI